MAPRNSGGRTDYPGSVRMTAKQPALEVVLNLVFRRRGFSRMHAQDRNEPAERDSVAVHLNATGFLLKQQRLSNA